MSTMGVYKHISIKTKWYRILPTPILHKLSTLDLHSPLSTLRSRSLLSALNLRSKLIMITRPLLRACVSSPRLLPIRRRAIFIAPGDAPRHASPGFAWLGCISAAAVVTVGLSRWVVSPRVPPPAMVCSSENVCRKSRKSNLGYSIRRDLESLAAVRSYVSYVETDCNAC
jgi:hypothetical protein